MGRPKESLPFGNNTLLGRTAELLLGCTWPVVIVARDQEQELPPLPLEIDVICDLKPGSGPLAALVTGMRHLADTGGLAAGDAVVAVGCDQPFLSARFTGWLADQLGDAQIAMPRLDDRLQPLCAAYRMEVLPLAEAMLAEGIDTVRTLAERARCRILGREELEAVDPGLRFLRGVNTPEDYQQALDQA